MTPLHFAPLQGYTEAPYRDAHATVFGGIDTYYTPFVRIERGEFRRKDTRDIEPENNHVAHLVPQLIASDVEKAKTILALFIEKGYREVSINLGCPFPILAKRHNGSGMLPYPEEVKALLAIVEQYPEIRFSVKMRLGWENPEECLALAPLLNDLPLEHIALHARLGKQQYKGEVDLDAFAAFADICQKPLIYNGDLLTVEDIQQ
uniref:tRNA-dihydrouridine synthase family protein n=1 Tax=Bacteroides neonati TaxID=1347393 RepID=UPI0005A7614F